MTEHCLYSNNFTKITMHSIKGIGGFIIIPKEPCRSGSLAVKSLVSWSSLFHGEGQGGHSSASSASWKKEVFL